jgi:hypothetical protein
LTNDDLLHRGQDSERRSRHSAGSAPVPPANGRTQPVPRVSGTSSYLSGYREAGRLRGQQPGQGMEDSTDRPSAVSGTWGFSRPVRRKPKGKASMPRARMVMACVLSKSTRLV